MLSLMATRFREKTLEFLSVLPTPFPEHRNKYRVVVVRFFCNYHKVWWHCRYDPDLDTWTVMSPMATCRIGVGLAVVNRLLYVVGGYDGESRLSTVECYHPENNEWHLTAPMNVTRSGAGEGTVCFSCHIIYRVCC